MDNPTSSLTSFRGVRPALLLCLLISVAGIADHDLWTPDEPREAALALSMSRSGNIVVPALAGEPFVEKPPLFYAAGAVMLKLFGAPLGNTAALRLTLALFGLGTLGMTWLLARRLMDREAALLAVAVLTTMPGFIHVTHWLLADNALMFFVAATLWCLAEAYLAGRLVWLLPAGACAAGAFLSKGLVGPVVAALGWVGLVAMLEERRRLLSARSVAFHLAALLIFVAGAVSWMVALRQVGGETLWHEWFWNNHVGRFTGQAAHLGHSQTPFYYLGAWPVYVLPWLVTLVCGLAALIGRLRRHTGIDRVWRCLACWGLGGLVLLSLSATKREIYLSVLLPAFAMMTAWILRHESHWSIRRSLQVWLALIFGALAVLALAPLSGSGTGRLLGGWGLGNLLAALVLVAGWIVFRQGQRSYLERWLMITALSYITLLTIMCPALDRVKSYGPAFNAMGAATAKAASAATVAAWNFDETTRACFYYYCGLVFPKVNDPAELAGILQGTHPRFDSVLTLKKGKKDFLPPAANLPPWRTVKTVRMGQDRVLLWIEGAAVPKQD